MGTIETNVYQYSELSEEAKEKARDWYRQASVNDEYFSDLVIEDAKEIGALFGLDIDKVYYSGFWSQGDGASFTGFYSYLKGALKSVKEYAPQDTELHAIVEHLQEIQRRSFYGISCNITQSGHYVHEMTMHFDFMLNGEYLYTTMTWENDLAEALRDYARWIYEQLEKAWDYENSDANVIENIEANEYEFLESGKIA